MIFKNTIKKKLNQRSLFFTFAAFNQAKEQKHMKRCILLLLIFLMALYGQQSPSITFELKEPIIITASRAPSSLMSAARTVSVLDSGAISRLPVHSVQDALGYIAGIDLQQRGSQGVQADVSLRGAGYEQTLILIDGIKVNDPQSGHHNLNLAFSLQDIERIEVLKGSGSRLYGPNAMGGVINIITKKPLTKKLDFSIIGGDFRYNEFNLNYDFQALKANHRLSLNRSNSSGYRPNTDFTIQTATYKNSFAIKHNPFHFTAAYNAKDFGASRFYHPAFPYQKEKTETFFLNMAGQIFSDATMPTFSPKIYWRRHHDDFLLDYTRPEWYHNKHQTDVLGAELLTAFSSRLGRTSILGEWQHSKIVSSNLGDHQRNMAGFSAEQQFTVRRWQIVLGSSFYYYNRWGWQISPGVDVSLQLTPHFTLYASGGTGFRPPTFTELYYYSPANRGNPQLKPERSVDIEAGARFRTKRTLTSFGLFRRYGSNLIDWIFESEGQYWQAKNVLQLTTSGLEVSSQWTTQRHLLKNIHFNYTYLTSDKAGRQIISKYVFNYLRHQFILGIDQQFVNRRLALSWKLRYEDRINSQAYFLTDVHVSWQIKRWRIFSHISNLFDQKYQDFASIPQPGRWFKMGVRFSVF